MLSSLWTCLFINMWKVVYVQYSSFTANRQKYLNESLTLSCFSADSQLICRWHTATASVPNHKCSLAYFFRQNYFWEMSRIVLQYSKHLFHQRWIKQHPIKIWGSFFFWPLCPQVMCTQITKCCLYKVFWALQCNCALTFLLSAHMMLIKMSKVYVLRTWDGKLGLDHVCQTFSLNKCSNKQSDPYLLN